MSFTNTFVRCRDPACDLLPDLALVMGPESLEERRILGQLEPKTKKTRGATFWILLAILALALVASAIFVWRYYSSKKGAKPNPQAKNEQPPPPPLVVQEPLPYVKPPAQVVTIVADSLEWTTEIIDSRLEKQAPRLPTKDDLSSQVGIVEQNINLLFKRLTSLESRLHQLENPKRSVPPTTAAKR